MASPNRISQPPDQRINAYRSDLAALSLKGRVEAEQFTAGTTAQVIAPVAPLHRHRDAMSALDSQALFGDVVTIYEVVDGWAWVQLERDGYVGYMSRTMLSSYPSQPTHRVAAIGTFVFSKPDIKSPPLMSLAMNAMLDVTAPDGLFLQLADRTITSPSSPADGDDGAQDVSWDTKSGSNELLSRETAHHGAGGYVIARHTSELNRPALDFVEIAERFIGTPYLWGGCTRLGLDCSGLVQVALRAAGANAPRDSDMQQAILGVDVLVPADLDGLQRGDLVFWPGHVGIMTDGMFLLHANAYHMATAIEPLAETVLRVAKTGASISAIKRLANYVR